MEFLVLAHFGQFRAIIAAEPDRKPSRGMSECQSAGDQQESSPAGFQGVSSQCAWAEEEIIRMLQELQGVI